MNRAFLYTGIPGSGGVMRNLGTLGGTESYGGGINDFGQITGRANTTGNAASHAFLYTGTPGSGGVMRDLGTLGGTNSAGVAINGFGQITGSSDTTGGASHAFLYIGTPGSGGVMRDLGTLGGSFSYGAAIDDTGQVVGSSETADGASHAFLYTGTPGLDGRMIDLDVWLDTVNPTEGAKWTLGVAGGINDAGLITGGGFYDGGFGGRPESRAFILDASALVPEPGSLGMLALGGITLLRRRRVARGILRRFP